MIRGVCTTMSSAASGVPHTDSLPVLLDRLRQLGGKEVDCSIPSQAIKTGFERLQVTYETANRFGDALIAARQDMEPAAAAMLIPRTGADHMKAARQLYLWADSSTGFGLSADGELMSVFATPGKTPKGVLSLILPTAIRDGAVWLKVRTTNPRLSLGMRLRVSVSSRPV